MHLHEFSRINGLRCEAIESGRTEFEMRDWLIALVGEVGEMANIIKMIRRGDPGYVEDDTGITPQARAELGAEIADVFIHLDLVARHFGLDLDTEVIHKFNRDSAKRALPHRLPYYDPEV